MIIEIINSFHTNASYLKKHNIEPLGKMQTERGVPIGNRTSQVFGMFYLNSLDRLVKEKLRIVVFGVENNSKDVIASANTQISVQVKVLINGESFALDKSRYSIVITLLDKGIVVSNFTSAGNYEIRVRLNKEYEDDYYFQTPNSVTFYAKTKTLFVENTPFFAVNDDYFEEGVTLVVESYMIKSEMINALGQANYDSIPNVSKVYKVVGFFKDGQKLEGEELEKLKNVKIYFKASNYNYFVLSNDTLQTANGDNGNILLTIDSLIIESIPENNNIIIFIGVALGIIVLIILIILKLIKSRKLKKANQGTVDMERLNSIANSASIARNNTQNSMQNPYSNSQNIQGVNIPPQNQINQNPNTTINSNINPNGLQQNINNPNINNTNGVVNQANINKPINNQKQNNKQNNK